MKKLIQVICLVFVIYLLNGISNSKIEASTITLGGTNYTINTSNEYNSESTVDWITIESDRAQGARVSLEFDINFLKDYNSSYGVIYYDTVKNWLNKLEIAFDYFCELNLNPQDKTLIIECTGVSQPIGGAYANSGNNRIVCNKIDQRGYLITMQDAYDNGFSDVSGIILHEMGHSFTKISGYSGFSTPWNFGTEIINLMMVQYVSERMIQSDNNIIRISSSSNCYCVSNNVLHSKYYETQTSKGRYLYDNYADCWENQIRLDKYMSRYYDGYPEIIYNVSKILDNVGLEITKKTFNKYFDEDIENYDTSDDFNKFLTFMKILKSYTSDSVWENTVSNYNYLYNNFVVKLNILSTEINLLVGESQDISYEYSFRSDDHEEAKVSFSVLNSNIATVDENTGTVKGKAIGTTKAIVKVGDKIRPVTINVKESKLVLDQTSHTFINGDSLQLTATVTPSTSSDKTLIWTSSNEDIAKVTANGKVLPGNKNGKCVITVSSSDGSSFVAKCDVTVKRATGINLNKNIYTFSSRNTLKLVPTIIPSQASKEVNWSSTNENVAKVDSNGIVTPVGSGECDIYAVTLDKGLLAKCSVTVLSTFNDVLKGDINQDGRININDVNYGLRGITKGTLTDEEKEIGNVNGDGVFNINDINKLLRFLVGKISTLD